ncbi:MAG: ATP-dependent Clp protease proteolytic subunit [Nitrospira sp.]|nr:ATP-dependent Clp protease proteolytic subunit [Nitrospira sp.]
MGNEAGQSSPTEIYASLAGNVDAQMVQRIFGGFSIAVNQGVKTVHLLVHSGGGLIGDGIGIYNYLRKLPLDVVAYNGGTVASIAVLIFLAAKTRKASKTATFMIHRSHWVANIPSTTDTLEAMSSMLKIDDGRVEEILKENINLPDEKWRLHQKADLTITASEALKYGLIHEISDFQVPPGHQLHNVNA